MSKRVIDDLAVFGGAPDFGQPLHVGRPNVGDRAHFMASVEAILDSRWFTNNGACVQALEAQLAEFLGVRHVVTVCNATIGLELAIRALDLHGEVIVPSMTFIATAHALQWQQIRPVFCDIDPRTHLIDPDRIEALITPRTTAIMGVHLWGTPCDTDAIEAVARRRGLQVLYDAAHAFACTRGGRRIGSFGRAEVFSFHATKFFNTFEGGAITTDDDQLAAKLRLMRNFGFAGYDNVVYIGTNGKMTEVCAAMGLASMRAVDRFMAVNRAHHADYARRLAGLPGLSLLHYDPAETHNHQYVVGEYVPEPGQLSRDELIGVLWAENVMARKYFYPGCHRMEPYRSLDPEAGARLPHTEAVAGRLLILPTGTGIGESELARVCELIRFTLTHGPEVAGRLRASTA